MKHIIFVLLLVLSTYTHASDRVVRLKSSTMGTYHVNVMVQDVTVDMLLDTGSSYVVVSSSLAKKIDLKPIRRITVALADGSRIKTYIYLLPELIVSGCIVRRVEAIVIPGQMSILGVSALRNMTPITLDLDHHAAYFTCNHRRNLSLHCRGCRVY